MKIIAETFERNFFPDGTNLFAIVAYDTKEGIYYVQIGHKTYKHLSETNALNKYNKYISLAREHCKSEQQ